MASHAHLLGLAELAARDPSQARRVAEVMAALVDQELQQGDLPPNGYVYAGAHTLVAMFDSLLVEPLPDPQAPGNFPLSSTNTRPQQLKVPFDCLILGVSGWAIPRLAPGLTVTAYNGLLEMGANPDGRDLFSVMWSTDGRTDYSTDGRDDHLEPAAAVLGTRRNPRPLAWQPGRDTLINVYARNLTNAINPSGFSEGRDPGWPLTVAVEFHFVNLETP